MFAVINRQHCAQRKAPVIKVTQRPILRFFVPVGRHIALMVLHAKFHPIGAMVRVQDPQN